MQGNDPIKYAMLLKKIYAGNVVGCPECGKEGLEHRFFSPDGSRIGFAIFHCPHCDAKAHLSRVKFPEGVEIEDDT